MNFAAEVQTLAVEVQSECLNHMHVDTCHLEAIWSSILAWFRDMSLVTVSFLILPHSNDL